MLAKALSELELDAIIGRLNAASHGPWVNEAGAVWRTGFGRVRYRMFEQPDLGCLREDEQRQADADREFVAHARQDVADLVETAKALRGLQDELDDMTRALENSERHVSILESEIALLEREYGDLEDERDDLRDRLAAG